MGGEDGGETSSAFKQKGKERKEGRKESRLRQNTGFHCDSPLLVRVSHSLVFNTHYHFLSSFALLVLFFSNRVQFIINMCSS